MALGLTAVYAAAMASCLWRPQTRRSEARPAGTLPLCMLRVEPMDVGRRQDAVRGGVHVLTQCLQVWRSNFQHPGVPISLGVHVSTCVSATDKRIRMCARAHVVQLLVCTRVHVSACVQVRGVRAHQ